MKTDFERIEELKNMLLALQNELRKQKEAEEVLGHLRGSEERERGQEERAESH